MLFFVPINVYLKTGDELVIGANMNPRYFATDFFRIIDLERALQRGESLPIHVLEDDGADALVIFSPLYFRDSSTFYLFWCVLLKVI